MPYPVLIPLLNPNEPEALLANLSISEGQQVAEGDLLCSLETTKSTADVHAETDGYVIGLQVSEGQTVRAGDTLCYLSESPDEPLPTKDDELPVDEKTALPSDLRITQPALDLARKHGLGMERLPIGPLITEGMVQSMLEKSTELEYALPETEFDPSAIIIYGGGGHGKSCLDLLQALNVYRVVGFVDDGIPTNQQIMGLPVLGGSEILPELYAQGVRLAVNAVGGIGDLTPRIRVFGNLARAGFASPAIVHPTAFVEQSARLAPGVQIFPHAYVGSEAQVGFGSIVNTGAIVSHDCQLGEIVNISPGAILAGEVTIGRQALIGMGATINLMTKIGPGARVGNGATVKSDVPENGIVRAGGVWPE
jgi:sugar O-acyltransferase (sialic acid O-acetyltransferase NeuD family)